jgi:hypothetical protein
MMDGSIIADLKSVVVPLNFLIPMAEKPVAYNYSRRRGCRPEPAKANSIRWRSAMPGR